MGFPVGQAAARDGPGTDALAWIGYLYLIGEGVARDDHRAFVYTEKATRQGHESSLFGTGYLQQDGQGCGQSYVRAAERFEKAA